MKLPDLLIKGLSEIGWTPDAIQEQQLGTFLSELELWKKKGLVNAEGDLLIIKHFLDCAAGFPLFPDLENKSIADLGSGAGFPGLLLAVYFKNTSVVLVERQGRRSAFLENCIALMKLSDRVSCKQVDSDSLTEDFDFITFRAFRPLSAIKTLVLKYLQKGSVFLCYKGTLTTVTQELEDFPGINSSLTPISVPFLNEERHLLVLKG